MNDLNVHCVYHADCLDGFTAAWVVKQFYPNATFEAAEYGASLPDVPADTHVLIVDFSYPADKLAELAQRVRWVTVIDHHASAINALTPYRHSLPSNVDLILDLERSGAGLTWDFLYKPEEHNYPKSLKERNGRGFTPSIVTYVQDRDLWRFVHGDVTRQYCRYLIACEFTFEEWDRAHFMDPLAVCAKGQVLMQSDDRFIDWHLKNTKRSIQLGPYRAPLVNVPRYLMSETLNRLTEDNDLVVGYYDTKKGRRFRLNAPKGSPVDCAALAEQFGGGGHRTSAGFTVPRDHRLAKV
jgi:oligoribonuclease NrnB/cAMP/cGMP phosphodiesterase (DHH superfamily)